MTAAMKQLVSRISDSVTVVAMAFTTDIDTMTNRYVISRTGMASVR